MATKKKSSRGKPRAKSARKKSARRKSAARSKRARPRVARRSAPKRPSRKKAAKRAKAKRPARKKSAAKKSAMKRAAPAARKTVAQVKRVATEVSHQAVDAAKTVGEKLSEWTGEIRERVQHMGEPEPSSGSSGGTSGGS